MKEQIKKFVEVEDENKILSTIEEMIANRGENEHLMGISVKRGMRNNEKTFVFGVEVEIFRGEFSRD